MNASNNVKISILIPMYNVESYIKACIESIANQPLRDIEIIVVDDGSTDGSALIVKKMAQEDSRIIYEWQENSGQSIARNFGVRLAKGEYIMFVDSDDYIEDNCLPHLYKLCKDNNLDILKTGWTTVDQNGKYQSECKPLHMEHIGEAVCCREYFLDAVNHWYQTSPCNGLTRRSFFIKHDLFFPEGIQFEDNTFNLKLFLSDLNARIMQTADTYYRARVRENSTTTMAVKPKKIADMVANIGLMNDFITDLDEPSLIFEKHKPVSLLTYHLTSYYYRLPKNERLYLRKKLDRRIFKDAIKYPMDRFQKWKVFSFIYFRVILDLYENIRYRHN